MRWLKCGLLAGWVGVHAALWSQWPPSPCLVLPADRLSSLVGFTDDGRSLLTANGTGVRVWNAASGQLQAEWPDPKPDPKRLTHYLGPKGRTAIAVRDPDRLARLDIDTGEWIELPPVAATVYGKDADKLFCWHDGLAADGRTFAYPAGLPETKSFVVRVWDTRQPSTSEIALARRGFSPALAPNGRMLAVWVDGDDHDWPYLLVVDTRTGREIGRMETPSAFLTRLAFSPDGQTLAAMGYDPPPPARPSSGKPSSWVHLWDTASRKSMAVIRGNWFAAWSADGRLLLARDDRLDAIDGHTGTAVADWDTPVHSDRSLFRGTFARGRIAAVESVQSPSLWTIGLNRLAARGVISYEYFRESRHTLHLYDTRTGHEDSTIWLQGSDRFCLSPDGRTLATLQFTGQIDRKANIYTWELPFRKPGGGVLGLMIAQVGLLVAGTAWRRRGRASRRQRDVGETSIPSA